MEKVSRYMEPEPPPGRVDLFTGIMTLIELLDALSGYHSVVIERAAWMAFASEIPGDRPFNWLFDRLRVQRMEIAETAVKADVVARHEMGNDTVVALVKVEA